MFGLARKEIETNLSRQALIDLIVNPFFLFSALGHFWIWGVFDKASNAIKPLSEASNPDFTRLKGVFNLGNEGGKLYPIDVNINGPVMSNAGITYEVSTADGRLKGVFTFFVQQSTNGNKIIASIEANEMEERASSFFSFLGLQKVNIKYVAQHLLEDHLAPFIVKYLEPREPLSPKLEVSPVVTEEGDVKVLLMRLNDVIKGIKEGFVSISGNDFTFLVTVENGNMRSMVYKDDNTIARGTSALGTVFLKSGKAIMKVYDVSVDDVLLKVAEAKQESLQINKG